MTPSTLTLAARLREELADVQRVAGRITYLVEKALSSGDDAYWDAVALNLHGFYTGLERIFEAIARELDGAVPGGPQSLDKPPGAGPAAGAAPR